MITNLRTYVMMIRSQKSTIKCAQRHWLWLTQEVHSLNPGFSNKISPLFTHHVLSTNQPNHLLTLGLEFPKLFSIVMNEWEQDEEVSSKTPITKISATSNLDYLFNVWLFTIIKVLPNSITNLYDQITRLFFNIWPFTAMEILPKSIKIRFKILQNSW